MKMLKNNEENRLFIKNILLSFINRCKLTKTIFKSFIVINQTNNFQNYIEIFSDIHYLIDFRD